MGRAGRTVLDASAGTLAGALATLPMSALMWAAGRAGLMGEQPPKRITDEALDSVGAHPSQPTRWGATALTHLGFGAAAGVPFALMHRSLPVGVPRVATGALYGVGVWASAYLGWVPAMGIMPSAEDDRPGRPLSMVAAHVVYGAALGAGLQVLRPRPLR
jgi:hypothetical protein